MADPFKTAVGYSARERELSVRLPGTNDADARLLFRELAEAVTDYTSEYGVPAINWKLNQIAQAILNACKEE